MGGGGWGVRSDANDFDSPHTADVAFRISPESAAFVTRPPGGGHHPSLPSLLPPLWLLLAVVSLGFGSSYAGAWLSTGGRFKLGVQLSHPWFSHPLSARDMRAAAGHARDSAAAAAATPPRPPPPPPPEPLFDMAALPWQGGGVHTNMEGASFVMMKRPRKPDHGAQRTVDLFDFWVRGPARRVLTASMGRVDRLALASQRAERARGERPRARTRAAETLVSVARELCPRRAAVAPTPRWLRLHHHYVILIASGRASLGV